jgi:hypothetical protein
MTDGLTRDEIKRGLKKAGHDIPDGSLHSLLRAAQVKFSHLAPTDLPHVSKYIYPPDSIKRIIDFIEQEKSKRKPSVA